MYCCFSRCRATGKRPRTLREVFNKNSKVFRNPFVFFGSTPTGEYPHRKECSSGLDLNASPTTKWYTLQTCALSTLHILWTRCSVLVSKFETVSKTVLKLHLPVPVCSFWSVNEAVTKAATMCAKRKGKVVGSVEVEWKWQAGCLWTTSYRWSGHIVRFYMLL